MAVSGSSTNSVVVLLSAPTFSLKSGLPMSAEEEEREERRSLSEADRSHSAADERMQWRLRCMSPLSLEHGGEEAESGPSRSRFYRTVTSSSYEISGLKATFQYNLILDQYFSPTGPAAMDGSLEVINLRGLQALGGAQEFSLCVQRKQHK
ncbi:hypothetical protein EYF80_039702 [Liparis tanakae]|uniref:Uncharacterized protein n=1 Tax=Liparis tanakae TaxID=230148 RepID=A0A4Z2G974_9TELE|nr:hypothetical protein EYF80_039702 [Liparis tanakae]